MAEGDVQKRIQQYNELSGTDAGRAIMLAMSMDHLSEKLESMIERFQKFESDLERNNFSDRLAVAEVRISLLSKIVYGALSALGLETLALAYSFLKH